MRTLAERFENFVMREPNSGCWLWTGFVNDEGYGYFGVAASLPRKAHRVSYEMHKGVIPDGLLVCHKCDTPSCVNQDHLFLGTDAENMRDRDGKSRLAFGRRNGRAKLNDASAHEIRALVAAGFSERNIAAKYSVDRGTIRAIKSEKTWKPQRLAMAQ